MFIVQFWFAVVESRFKLTPDVINELEILGVLNALRLWGQLNTQDEFKPAIF